MLVTTESTDLGFLLSVQIGHYAIPSNQLSVKLSTSIKVPYIAAEVRVKTGESISDLSSFVVGQDALIGLTGGFNFEDVIELPLSVTAVKVPVSDGLHTPNGEVVLRLVSRWAYQERALKSKSYPEVTNLEDVIRSEHADVGLAEALDIVENMRELSKPKSIYRTQGVLDSMLHRILPWVRSEAGAPLFWYQTLKGNMRIQSAAGMLEQSLRASLVPEYTEHPFDIDVDETYLFDGRSYQTNPSRTDLFRSVAHYVGADETVQTYEAIENVGGVPGKAVQRQRDLGYDELDIWYTGYRPLEQIQAHAAFLRRNHLFHQVHTLKFEDFEVATTCVVGSRVKLFDLVPYIPEDSIAPTEELAESGMSSEYIVGSSHLYYDGINDTGFRGSKLDLVKLAYTDEELIDAPDAGAYVEV